MSDNFGMPIVDCRSPEEKIIDSLRQQNIELLTVVEQMREALSNCVSKLESQVARNPELPAYYAEVVKQGFEALALSPSSDLLEARDLERDARLLEAARIQLLSGGGLNLTHLALSRESGEWKPEV